MSASSPLGRREFLGTTAAATLGLSLGALQARAQETRPLNVLFILTDQHRRDCVGAYGNEEVKTPNLDRIAEEGARFDRMYVTQPVCSPCRSSIWTGMYPHSSGVWENKVPLPETSKCISEMLIPEGYACGYFGKWHLGRRDAWSIQPEYPNDGRGDNHYFGEGEERLYGADVIAGDTVEYLKANRDRPFFAVSSWYPPHPPYSAPEEFLEMYSHIEDHDRRVYYAMCTAVDRNAGRLLDTLDELGLAENTLVIFTTEHGHYFDHRWNHHNKRLCYDIASRIPLLMRLPGIIPAGITPNGLISSADLVPTILGFMNCDVPAQVEGVDQSMLANGSVDRIRDYVAIENIPYPFDRDKGEERCVRCNRYKLILSTHRPPELYDMHTDPDEQNNRWDGMKDSDDARRLRRYMREWAMRTNDELAPMLLESA